MPPRVGDKAITADTSAAHPGTRCATRHGHAPWTQEEHTTLAQADASPLQKQAYASSSLRPQAPSRPQWLLTGLRPQLEAALNSTRDRSPGRWGLRCCPSMPTSLWSAFLTGARRGHFDPLPFCGSYENQSSEPRLPRMPGMPGTGHMSSSKLLGQEGSCSISLSN